MKTKLLPVFALLLLGAGLTQCKRKEVVPPAPDPYVFLNGTWRYANGAECVYDRATRTAKGTKVPTNNGAFGFVVGEDYWRSVVSTGTDRWTYQQIVRYGNGTVTYVETSASRQDANTLAIENTLLGRETLTRVP
jgi:hypothetical protein